MSPFDSVAAHVGRRMPTATNGRPTTAVVIRCRPVRSRRLHQLARRAGNELVHRAWYQVRSFGAIAPGTRAAERFGSFGAGSLIAFPPAGLFGEASIHIGAGTLVAPWASLAAGYSPEQPDVPARALVIGDRCVIGIRSGIVAHESVELGDDVWFGQDVYVTDANHGFDDPDEPIGNQIGTPEPVRSGSGSWVGHGAVILPGARLGRNVVVAAGAVVLGGDVPDHSVLAGVPARVVRHGPAPAVE